jgi:subtilisin-like proprotein convertase family protein
MLVKGGPVIATAVAMVLAAGCGKESPSTSSPPQQAAPTPTTQTFSNPSSITIPAGAPGTTRGPANPYPSTINVSGMGGSLTKVVVTIAGISHPFPDDLAMLLVGPGGQNVVFMFNVGCGFGVIGVTLTFDQAAPQALPDEDQIVTGTYRPTSVGVVAADLFVAPAPGPPYSLSLDVFNGTNPNGTWRLFVFDDATGDVGNIAGGWSLTVTTGSSATNASVAAGSPARGPLGTLTAGGGCRAGERDAGGK